LVALPLSQEDFRGADSQQLAALVDWAKRVPRFRDLKLEDQVILLKSGNRPTLFTHLNSCDT